MSGLGANGGYAVVLPDQTPSAWDVMQTLRQQNLQRQLLEEKRRREEEAHRNVLLNYMGEAFNPKNFDGIFNDRLAELQNKYAGMIADEKNRLLPLATLRQAMSRDLQELMRWNQAVKAGREMVDNQLGGLKDYKGLRQDYIKDLAYHDLLYKNVNGKKVLRSAEEIQKDIEARRDLVGESMSRFPREVLQDELDVAEWMKNLPVSKLGESKKFINKHTGFSSDGWDAEIYADFQEVVEDKDKGARVQTRFEIPAGADGKPLMEPVLKEGSPVLDAEGKPKLQPLRIAPKSTYDAFAANPIGRLTLNKRLLDYLDEQRKRGVDVSGITPDSQEGEILKRKLLYDMLDGRAPKSLRFREERKENPAPVTHSTTTVIIDPNQKKPSLTKWEILAQALNGGHQDAYARPETKTVVRGGRKEEAPTGRYNILPAVGGSLKTVDKQGRRVEVTRIMYDPKKRDGYEVYYKVPGKEDEAKEPIRVSKQGLKNWLLPTARANSERDNFGELEEAINRLFDGAGNYAPTPMDRLVQPKVVTTTSRTQR